MNVVDEKFDPRKISEFSEKDIEGVIRPKEFEDFSGQDKILENLKIFVNGLFFALLASFNVAIACSLAGPERR